MSFLRLGYKRTVTLTLKEFSVALYGIVQPREASCHAVRQPYGKA